MADSVEVIHISQEQVSSEVLSLLTKAEIDTQISTAKAFPRSLTGFMEKVRSIATINEAVASSCGYAVSRSGKTITGPSVRFAEIVVSAYGNIRAAARVVANDGRTITAQGICHDLETNSVATIEVKRKITDKNGKTYSEDMQVVTGNAACAIAYRNAVFKVVPAALTEDIFEDVMRVAKGTLATLTSRREKAISWFSTVGVKPEDIFKKLNVKGAGDIDLEALHVLNGFRSSIKNGESTVKEIFFEEEEPKPTVNKEEQRIELLLKGKSAEEAIAFSKTLPKEALQLFDNLFARLYPDYKADQKPASTNLKDVMTEAKAEEQANAAPKAEKATTAEVKVEGKALTAAEKFSLFNKQVAEADTLEKLAALEPQATTTSMKNLYSQRYDEIVEAEMDKAANDLSQEQ